MIRSQATFKATLYAIMTESFLERPAMPSVAPAMRTSEQIRAEIEQTFGFLPPFFEPALPTPRVLENLWQQTLSAYALNPLSALFKEKLNALLSRFCAAPYCIIVHSSALRPLGMTAQQVLALLDAPPSGLATELPMGGLPAPAPEEAAAPAPDSLLERTLLYCATAVFLERADAPSCQAELRRLLGPDLFPIWSLTWPTSRPVTPGSKPTPRSPTRPTGGSRTTWGRCWRRSPRWPTSSAITRRESGRRGWAGRGAGPPTRACGRSRRARRASWRASPTASTRWTVSGASPP